MTQGTRLRNELQGWDGEEVRGRLEKEGTCVCLWLIHVAVWQEPAQYCKTIILRLKMSKF